MPRLFCQMHCQKTGAKIAHALAQYVINGAEIV